MEKPKFKLVNSYFICSLCTNNESDGDTKVSPPKHTNIQECKNFCHICNYQSPEIDKHNKILHSKGYNCDKCNKPYKEVIVNENNVQLKCYVQPHNKTLKLTKYDLCQGRDRLNKCNGKGEHVCPFLCPKCNCTIGMDDITITEHIKKCKLKCFGCNRSFKNIKNLNKHKCEVSSLKCEVCGLDVIAKDIRKHICLEGVSITKL